MAKRGNPNWAKDASGKGTSGNPGGHHAAVLRARDELNAALALEKDVIHEALIKLVKDGNPQATMYAHQKLAGKPPAADEDNKHQDGMVAKLHDAMSERPVSELLSFYRVLVSGQPLPGSGENE